jgi:hypothetical protein
MPETKKDGESSRAERKHENNQPCDEGSPSECRKSAEALLQGCQHKKPQRFTAFLRFGKE